MTKHRIAAARRPWCKACGLTPADTGWDAPCERPGEKLADPFPHWRHLFALAIDPSTQVMDEREGV